MSMHKNISFENPFCESCQAFLPDLSFEMHDFYLWLIKNNPDMHIYAGFRNKPQQHEDFLSGKSDVDWPNSKHNFMEGTKPFSKAIDIFVLDPDGIARWPATRFQDLYNEAILSNHPITWGGAWERFPDANHYEVDD